MKHSKAMKKSSILTVAVLFAMNATVFAAPVELSLKESISQALANNPAIKMADPIDAMRIMIFQRRRVALFGSVAVTEPSSDVSSFESDIKPWID